MQQTLHLKRTQKYNMKKIYVGNLNKDVTINDLNELFGLKTTRYLQEYCSIELPVNEKTGKSRGFAFISCPDHVCNELIKLNGINFLESCFFSFFFFFYQGQSHVLSSKKLHQLEVGSTKEPQIQ